MRSSPTLIVAVLLACSFGAAAPADEPGAGGPYEGHRLVSVRIRSQRDLMNVMQLGEMLACSPGPGPVSFVIPGEAMPALEALGLEFAVTSDNVQALIDAERSINDAARAQRDSTFFDAYRTIAEINDYIDTLDALPGLPAAQATKFSIGTTIEGRTVYGLHVTTPPVPGAPQKPVFLITATQHAREWIAASTAMWIADQLVRGYGSDPTITALADNVDFYIIPVVNPDGYSFTWTSNRFWRKNRRANAGGTFGVDLNRNWGYQWGGSGSSSSGSSDIYHGTAPFSEPETANIRALVGDPSPPVPIVGVLPNLKGHIDLHSYSQLVLGPWGYTTAASPRTSELNGLTSAMVSSISSTNSVIYTGGPAASTLYVASGVVPDWTFGAVGALGWTYELRDTGANGFVLPPDQIRPTGREAFNGIVVLANHIQIRLQIASIAPPSSLTAGLDAFFNVSMATQNRYAAQPGSAKLLRRNTTSGAFTESPLTGAYPATPGPIPTGGSTSSTLLATIVSPPCGQTVRFYVQATADDGSVVTDPAGAPATVYSATVSPCPPCPGDANADRAVDFADVTAVFTQWGSTGDPTAPGDADHNGSVDFGDVTSVIANWGTPCP